MMCWRYQSLTSTSPSSKWVNSLRSSDAIWQQIWVNIGSGNGLLPDGTKPLPDVSTINHLNLFENYMSKLSFRFPRDQWVNASWAETLPFFLVPGIWKFVIDFIQDVARFKWPYHLSRRQQRSDVMSLMPIFHSSATTIKSPDLVVHSYV